MTDQKKRSRAAGPSAGSTGSGQDLRQRAEARYAEAAPGTTEDGAALSPEETRKTLHELRVHQIELEMQNEELRRAQAELEASRARYFDLFDLAPVGYLTLSEKGLILEANLTAAALLGTERRALAGRPLSRFIPAEDQDIYYLHAKRLFADGRPQTCELRLLRQGAEPFHARLDAVLSREEGGAPICHCAVVDITPRKLAEETIRYRLQFEQKIATISSRFVGGEDFDDVIQTALADMGSFRRADRAYLFLLRNGDEVMDNTHEWCAPGVSLQKDNLQNVPTAATPWWMNKLRNREIIRIPNVALLPPEAAAERAILESQQIKSLIALPVYMGDKLGGFIGFDNVRSTGEWGDEDNSLLQVAAELVGRTIAQRRAEQALHESREVYRTIFQGSRAVQLLIEPESGAIVDANPAAIDFYGYTHDQLTALRIGDLNTLSEQEIRQRMTAARDGSARQFEFQHRLASGQLRHVQVFSGTIVIAGKTLLNSIILDITDRQIAEAALQFTQFAVDHSVDVALWMNPSGRFTYVNDAACRLLGYSREELLTMSVPDIDPLYPKERWRENWAALCQHKHQVIESRHQAKDGHTFPVEITDNLIEIDGQMFNCAIVRDITERKRAEEELQQRYAQLERWQHATVGREVRMIELKQEINSLCRAAGLPERYATKTPAELTLPDSGPAATSNEQGEVS